MKTNPNVKMPANQIFEIEIAYFMLAWDNYVINDSFE